MNDASGLTGKAGNLAKTIEGWIDKIPTPGYKAPKKKEDTSWHDEQVKEANESFRKAAQGPKLGVRKKSPKKPVKKPIAAKR